MAASSESMTAAAILACEASRQQLEAAKSSGPRDVPGELLQLYRWYVDQLSGSAQAGGSDSQAGSRPPSMPVGRPSSPTRSW